MNEAEALALIKRIRKTDSTEIGIAVLQAVCLGKLAGLVSSGVGAIGVLTEAVSGGVGAIGELTELIREQSGFMRDSINALSPRK